MSKQKIILKGIGASPGKTRGRVRIINFLEETKKIAKGDILVVPFLTLDLVSLLKKNLPVAGIITDKGGFTCHAAIVARELNIPYVAAAVGATKILKNDSIITVDSKKGLIYEET